MSPTTFIIEQRVTKLAEEYERVLGGGEFDRRKSKAFVALTTSVVLDISLDEALTLLTDGSHDLAVDALHVGDVIEGEFVVTLVQGKYHRTGGKYHRRGEKGLSTDEIRKVIQTVGMLFDPDLEAPHARVEVLARVEEIRSLVREGNLPSVRVVLCNNGKRWGADGDALIRESRLPEDQVVWEYVDPDALVAMLQRPKQVDDEIQMVGAAVVEEFDFCRVMLGKVGVTELARLFGTHGDRLLERNIRGYLSLRNNRVNQKIAGTLRSKQKRSSFYFFNNGVTVTCSKFRHNGLQAGNYRVKLENLQVINGGQTCHTVRRTLEELPEEDFSQAHVLVRIYEIDNDQRDLIYEITHATNSQNPVDRRDLQANDDLQARLELGLGDLGYTYLRKREQGRANEKTIMPEEAAEAVMAVRRRKPHVARSNRNQMFGRLYSEIFSEELTPQQVVLAVNLLRLVRGRSAAMEEPPRFVSYAQHMLAMLIADDLRRVPVVGDIGDRETLEALVTEHSLYERAVLQVRLLLALCGFNETKASLQRLSSAFRRGELAGRASSWEAAARPIVERIRQNRDRIDEITGFLYRNKREANALVESAKKQDEAAAAAAEQHRFDDATGLQKEAVRAYDESIRLLEQRKQALQEGEELARTLNSLDVAVADAHAALEALPLPPASR